jgi:chromosome segregation ATPase
MLVECENKNNNLEVEKESFEKHCSELNDERNILKDYVEKLSKDFKGLQEKTIKENQENKQKINALEEKISSLEGISSKVLVENSVIKQQLDSNEEKIRAYESNIKKKINELSDMEIKYKTLAEDYKVRIK